MSTFRNIMLIAASCVATVLSPGCKGKSNSIGGLMGPPTQTGTPPSTNPNKTGGTIIPPTPVIGSYLVAEIRRDDGTPIPKAKVGLLGNQTNATPTPAPTSLKLWFDGSTAQVIYETESNEAGQVSFPVSQIFSDEIDLKIQEAGRTLYSKVKLPGDIAQSVSQKRVDGGLSALPNYPASPSSPEEATAPLSDVPLARKLALQLPQNRVDSTPISGQVELEQVLLMPYSLPYSLPSNTKLVDIFSQVSNSSVDDSVRFNWQNSFSDPAEIRIAYSFSEGTISGWDGEAGNLPGLSVSRSGVDFVTNYSACTDSEYRTSNSGNIMSVDGGKCGFLRNQFPFNDGADVFVRLSGESSSIIKLSPVFRFVFNNTPPNLTSIANQTVVMNTTTVDVPLNLMDNETPLICGTALSVQSSNTTLLANSSIYIGGSYPTCKLTLLPRSGTTGISTITVTASDGSQVGVQTFIFNVKNPPADLSLSRDTIWENSGTNAVVGNLTAVVPDAPDSVFLFSLATGIGDEDNSLFNISGTTLRANASFDFETKSLYKLRIRATDVTSAYFEKALFIRVVDIFEDPYLDKVILLAHMDGTHGGTSIVDSSPAQRTLTRVGAGKIDESNKKFGSASYFSSTLSDRIEAGTIDIKATDDFTWECWWYPTEFTNGYKALFAVYSTTGGYSYSFLTNDDATSRKLFFFKWIHNISYIYTTDGMAGINITLNTWHHVALSRQGSTLRIFFDGVLHQSATFADALAGNFVIAHHQSQTGTRFGYLDDFRVTVGQARYTANFTPPSAPFSDGTPPALIPNIGSATYSQSSIYPGSTAAQNAFLTDSSISTGIAATMPEANTGTIKVDLGSIYQIDRVMIGTPDATTLSGVTDKTFAENKIVEYSLDGTNWNFSFNTGTLPGLGIFRFNVDFHARYVRIRNSSGGTDVLGISEFLVLPPGQTFQAGNFNPVKLQPLAWYDAADASTVQLDSITNPTPRVTNWNDKGFRGRHLTQSIPANRPGAKPNAANGRNVLEWPATDNDLFLENQDAISLQEIYAVGKFAGGSNNFLNNEGILSPRNNSALPWLGGSGSSQGLFNSIFTNVFLNAANGVNRVSNVFPEVSSMTLLRSHTNAVDTSSSSGITVGIDRLNITQGRGWKGQISELLIFAAPLSSTDRTTVESYLKTKWGISP